VGDVTFTTKAGTNTIHGSLFEYLQNNALDARVLNFDVKAPKRFNTFGGSLGRTVRIPKLHSGKDKTFFFFDYEGNRKVTPVADGSILRPDLVGNPIPTHRTLSNYFNISAFAPTPVGAARVGNAGVGILEGPGTIAVNAGLSKTMTLREGLRLRFEATFTNVLNHTNFAPPATNVSNPSTFGVLQSAQTAENGGNRTGQVALRLDF
jgi:hypothetical protein